MKKFLAHVLMWIGFGLFVAGQWVLDRAFALGGEDDDDLQHVRGTGA